MQPYDIKRMKKDDLLEYALNARDELIDAQRYNKAEQDKTSKLRKELNKSKENALLVNFAIDTQIRAEYPQLQLLQIPPEQRPDDMEFTPPDRWYDFLVCLRNKLSDVYIGDTNRREFY